ncbi:MAG: hypothetical protein Q8P46_11470 [Hyphomicrobiales bacterium]|nr:hypothetical protein [Hyphomicrobiales bacterium]
MLLHLPPLLKKLRIGAGSAPQGPSHGKAIIYCAGPARFNRTAVNNLLTEWRPGGTAVKPSFTDAGQSRDPNWNNATAESALPSTGSGNERAGHEPVHLDRRR